MKLQFLFVPALLLVFSFIFAISCAKYEKKEAAAPAAAPAADGKALWSYITKDSPYTKWPMYPGKEAFYKGTMPHGALLTTYVTNNAHKAINDKTGILPNRTIVVKENYMPDKTLAAVTVMYKVPGYNPGDGDWFWAKYSPNGEIAEGGMAAGKVPMCIACHSGSKANDYIMTASIK